jgi:ABC-type multidrug transport system ATPase subunit
MAQHTIIEVRDVSQRVRGGRTTLHGVSLTIGPGELVAIIGGSGTGKTTLLDTMCGLAPPAAGEVRFDGHRGRFGYVPQDDIIHLDLPLRRTLRYAARLRFPAAATADEIDGAVRNVLRVLDLADRGDVPVGSLSGGQRKRASIAVELLTRPRVFFLDEPTSGLDPARGAELMRVLRRLASEGTTVVLATHNPLDAGRCDKIAVLADDGYLAFFGPPAEACAYFRTDGIEGIYERLAGEGTPQSWGRRFTGSRMLPARNGSQPTVPALGTDGADGADIDRVIGPVRQWAVLTRRNVDILVRNRLTLAILIGSPVMVLLMFAVLFRPGAFDPAHPSPGTTVMILFWIAFGGFFFGLTYGLLQISTEFAVLRRERFAGLRAGPYVLAKACVLVPLLVVVDAALLGVLRALNRLPAHGDYGAVFLTLALASASALGLGLLISAAVSQPAQATLALPMVCFPQVLFVGAILPVPVMAVVGRWISYAMSNRWAFEGLGHSLGVDRLWADGRSPLGPPLLASYGGTFSHAVTMDWAILGGFTVVFLAAACAVVVRKTPQQRMRGASPSRSGSRSR